MGVEKLASSHNANVSSSGFAKSSETVDDHSNPQQGTGMTKATMPGKHDHGRQNKNDRNASSSNSSVIPQSSRGEDKRKLFVGGLPTDSKSGLLFINLFARVLLYNQDSWN